MPDKPKGPGRPLHSLAAEDDRCRTLGHVGRIICSLGLSTRPLAPYEVLRIERRALRKVQACLISKETAP